MIKVEMGIVALGPRKKILGAISELQANDRKSHLICKSLTGLI
jgi:hypothetical protein